MQAVISRDGDVVKLDWKRIRFYETDREELYDLSADVSERNDLERREARPGNIHVAGFRLERCHN